MERSLSSLSQSRLRKKKKLPRQPQPLPLRLSCHPRRMHLRPAKTQRMPRTTEPRQTILTMTFQSPWALSKSRKCLKLPLLTRARTPPLRMISPSSQLRKNQISLRASKSKSSSTKAEAPTKNGNSRMINRKEPTQPINLRRSPNERLQGQCRLNSNLQASSSSSKLLMSMRRW